MDTTNYYYIIKGDSIPREFIDLEEVVLLTKLQFISKEDRRRYLILKRKTRKVYPFHKFLNEDQSKKIMEILESLEELDDVQNIYTNANLENIKL